MANLQEVKEYLNKCADEHLFWIVSYGNALLQGKKVKVELEQLEDALASIQRKEGKVALK